MTDPAKPVPKGLDTDLCPSCRGTGECAVCRGASSLEPGYTCQCEATHRCVDCFGMGTYAAYATEQMRRLRAFLVQQGILP